MVQTNSNTLPSWWDENYSAAREEYKGTAQLERTFGVEIEFLYTGTLSTRDLVKKLSTPTSPVVFKTYGEHFHSGYDTSTWELTTDASVRGIGVHYPKSHNQAANKPSTDTKPKQKEKRSWFKKDGQWAKKGFTFEK